jgi:serine/threonine protein kinase
MEIPGYKIQRQIGQGGMATVYLAIQESLHRPVVLKVMKPVDTDSEEWKERFLSEGRLIASLHHPNIVTIYDIGISGEHMYISMEFIDGGDLKKRMELPIPAGDCLDYLIKIGSALGAAHRHGIVHRDVKPANILFRDEDTPLLTDFGIAKQVDMDMDLTATGIFLGSPNYVSPEQADGLPVDGRSDIYSLGCIFYEMLTGMKPYQSESVIDIVIKHKQAPIPELPEEYKEFQPLLERMLAKKREDRFSDCASMVDYIKEIKQQYGHRTVTTDLDLTVADSEAIKADKPARKLNSTLLVALSIAILINIGLKIIEINIKGPAKKETDITTQSTLLEPQVAVAAQNNEAPPVEDTNFEASPAVKKALLWLGRQSLDEFRLTYPPKNNAHYYFSKLLEADPGNEQAITGILMIAERYAILADQSLAKNDYEKSRAYINIGLQIDPENDSLQSLRSLIDELEQQSLWNTIKSMLSLK